MLKRSITPRRAEQLHDEGTLWAPENKEPSAAKPTQYRMLYRPLMFATYPRDVVTEWVELPQDGIVPGAFPGVPVSRHVFGVFTTDRPLTGLELASYQIEIV